MAKSDKRTVVFWAAILVAVVSACCRSDEPKHKRNIILIMVDTLRADHLGCYGGTQTRTPNLDVFAQDSVVFTRCFAAAPATLPSTSSLMTSRVPRSHGTPRNGFPLAPSNVTLARTLKDAGYTTAAFVSSAALSSRTGIQQGFDTFDETFDLFRKVDQFQRRAESTNLAVRRWLSLQDDAKKPFFLFVHYFDPHFPYDPPAPFDTMYDEAYEGFVDGSMRSIRIVTRRLEETGRADDDARHMSALYRGEVSYTDLHVGRLLIMLRELGLFQDSILVFTADHGENLVEHDNYFNHGLRVYDTTIHVPLLVKAEGLIEPDRTVDSLVATIDIAPTLLDLIGVERPSGFEGRSFSRHLLARGRDRADSARTVLFSEAVEPYWGDYARLEEGVPWRNEHKSRCVRSARYKYIQTPYLEREELYDMVKDPGETTNLLPLEGPARKDDLDELKKHMALWVSRLPESTAGEQFRMDRDTREKLKALGYME